MRPRATSHSVMAQDPSISCGLADGRPVFVDLQDDSYFRLEADEEAVFLSRLTDNSIRRAEPLRIGSQPVELVSVAPATGGLLDQARSIGRAGAGDILSVWRLLAGARRAIGTRPIAQLIEEIEGGFRANRGNEGFEEVAARFLVARRFVPIARNCLSDSIALMHWLAGRGQPAMLVFGVKLDPFAAHCLDMRRRL